MVRDPGWHLLDFVRLLERALFLVDLLEATMVHRHSYAFDSLVLESVLIAGECIIT